MKLCIDCKYYNNDYCEHPNARSPVNGRSEIKCTVQRGHAWNQNFCRIQGHWFELKPMGDTAAALQDYAVHSIMQAAERAHKREHIPGPCSNCGDPNHWRPDCPKLFPVKATRLPWWKRIFS